MVVRSASRSSIHRSLTPTAFLIFCGHLASRTLTETNFGHSPQPESQQENRGACPCRTCHEPATQRPSRGVCTGGAAHQGHAEASAGVFVLGGSVATPRSTLLGWRSALMTVFHCSRVTSWMPSRKGFVSVTETLPSFDFSSPILNSPGEMIVSFMPMEFVISTGSPRYLAHAA